MSPTRTLFVCLAASAALSCGGSSSSGDAATGGDAPAGVDGAAGTDGAAFDGAAVTSGATWTFGSHPTCTAVLAPLCVNVASGGGYQLAAGAACPLNNNLSIYLPGDTTVPAAGTYTIHPASTFGDLINLPEGQAAVQVVFHPDGSTQELWWAQSGTITVTNVDGKVGYSMTDIPTQIAGAGPTENLTAMAQCPCTGIGCTP